MIHGVDRGQLPSVTGRCVDLASWSDASVPLLRDPRELVVDLHQRHLPQPGTSVIAVLDVDHRVVASASVTLRPPVTDGWLLRNALLPQLRRVIAHDLRLPVPRRTAVLLCCRDGAPGWTEEDGGWMWALRDTASLHGLRCGAYVALTPSGWQVLGEVRSGRTPHADSWSERPVHTVSALPTVSELPRRGAPTVRPASEYTRSARPWPASAAGPEPMRHIAR
ncbi:hypothetical protein OG455_13270 [Kitasatospora sp. NBC_01287]|uniref:hypothetical protein n=1 Tax=Kitasatospora sp. NBC_01287 TaxID=2903573 RepID=UPI002256FAE1|nr:hypothetical protein [Kitasatospora sp. NBC_01287]MCX4746483.1 hypothetical protein [Kitasatospora sp. NBC_01287]